MLSMLPMFCCFFFFSTFSFIFHSWFNNSYLSVAGSIKNVEAGVALSLVLRRHTKAWIWIAPKIGPFGYIYYNDSYYDNPIAHESNFHLQKQPVFPLKFFFFFFSRTIYTPPNTGVLWEVRHQSWQQPTWSPSNTNPSRCLVHSWVHVSSFHLSKPAVGHLQIPLSFPLLLSSPSHYLMSSSNYFCIPLAG